MWNGQCREERPDECSNIWDYTCRVERPNECNICGMTIAERKGQMNVIYVG